MRKTIETVAETHKNFANREAEKVTGVITDVENMPDKSGINFSPSERFDSFFTLS